MNVKLKILEYDKDSIGPSDLTLATEEVLTGKIIEVGLSATPDHLPVDFVFITEKGEKKKFDIYQLKDFEEK